MHRGPPPPEHIVIMQRSFPAACNSITISDRRICTWRGAILYPRDYLPAMGVYGTTGCWWEVRRTENLWRLFRLLSELGGCFLRGYDVHTAAARFPSTGSEARYGQILLECSPSGLTSQAHESALFPALAEKSVGVYAVFGERGSIE